MPREGPFLPDLEKLSEVITSQNKEIAIVVINTPNNPTGSIYPRETISKIAEILKPYPEIAILSDRSIQNDSL